MDEQRTVHYIILILGNESLYNYKHHHYSSIYRKDTEDWGYEIFKNLRL